MQSYSSTNRGRTEVSAETPETGVEPEFFDVVIIGAGLSGIGAAVHLSRECPGKRFAILEARASIGGTWDLFRYPGIRSDSDMHTLGYNFRPWRESKAIADGPSILKYVRETAAEHDIDRHIRFGHRVVSASWSTEDASWTVEAQRAGSGDIVRLRCNFIMSCAGYYCYEHGYTPEFEGRERFRGEIVHPQDWPDSLDYRNRKVIIIGSGATAVTLLPEMARDVEHVIMLQRSPTYIISWPDADVIANTLRRVLPDGLAYRITRWKNIAIQRWLYRKSRKDPEKVRRALLDRVREELGEDYDVDTHFTPTYMPWDQRLCLVPNSDLFAAIRSGKASVVTDTIDTLTERGILLDSGTELEADIIVTATGLELEVIGGIRFVVDGEAVDFADRFTYKGVMCSDVPNLISTFGYINASWTLRADLIAEYACRVINHMDATGCRQCTPRLRDSDRKMPQRPYITEFSSGYIQRMLGELPKQGDHDPWTNLQDYKRDRKVFRRGRLEDGVLTFSNMPIERCA